MDVFDLRNRLVSDYRSYTRSFIKIRDARIQEDELHTYRGRQGADVAMLIRRCRHAFCNDIICVGTSARWQAAEVAKINASK